MPHTMQQETQGDTQRSRPPSGVPSTPGGSFTPVVAAGTGAAGAMGTGTGSATGVGAGAACTGASPPAGLSAELPFGAGAGAGGLTLATRAAQDMAPGATGSGGGEGVPAQRIAVQCKGQGLDQESCGPGRPAGNGGGGGGGWRCDATPQRVPLPPDHRTEPSAKQSADECEMPPIKAQHIGSRTVRQRVALGPLAGL